MSAAMAAIVRSAPHFCAGGPRRVILSDPTGERLGEVPLQSCGARLPVRPGAARLLAATSPNWLDRPSTGDALHVVVGRRAFFGHVVDVDRVSWFSHPRVARADMFSSLPDREVRTLLYNLHSDDPDTVSEIIWETSGRISAQTAPALPAGIDPGSHRLLERSRDEAAYWKAIGRILAHGGRSASPSPARRWSGTGVDPHHEPRNSPISSAASTG